ncbi:hypothetical protein RA210_U90090 [Rubrivivax sp. A210]|nr:hypothetical protein RA210_U90090 [Rubrivivax sp. A210]
MHEIARAGVLLVQERQLGIDQDRVGVARLGLAQRVGRCLGTSEIALAHLQADERGVGGDISRFHRQRLAVAGFGPLEVVLGRGQDFAAEQPCVVALVVACEHPVDDHGGLVELAGAGKHAGAQDESWVVVGYGRQRSGDRRLGARTVAQRAPGHGDVGLEGRLGRRLVQLYIAVAGDQPLVVTGKHQRPRQRGQDRGLGRVLGKRLAELGDGRLDLAHLQQRFAQQHPRFDVARIGLQRRLELDDGRSVLFLGGKLLARGDQRLRRIRLAGRQCQYGAHQRARKSAPVQEVRCRHVHAAFRWQFQHPCLVTRMPRPEPWGGRHPSITEWLGRIRRPAPQGWGSGTCCRRGRRARNCLPIRPEAGTARLRAMVPAVPVKKWAQPAASQAAPDGGVNNLCHHHSLWTRHCKRLWRGLCTSGRVFSRPGSPLSSFDHRSLN